MKKPTKIKHVSLRLVLDNDVINQIIVALHDNIQFYGKDGKMNNCNCLDKIEDVLRNHLND